MKELRIRCEACGGYHSSYREGYDCKLAYYRATILANNDKMNYHDIKIKVVKDA